MPAVRVEFEQQIADDGSWNGAYWRKEYREDGSLMATFNVPGHTVRVLDGDVVILDHTEALDEAFTGEFEGYSFTAGHAPLSVEIVALRTAAAAAVDRQAQYDALRAKGWANLSATEKEQARAIAFDLNGIVLP